MMPAPREHAPPEANPLETGHRKISMLFAACLLFLLALSVAFGSVIIYRLAHLQQAARALQTRSLLVGMAGQAMLADVSRMHGLMIRAILAPDAGTPDRVDAALRAEEAGLRQNLALVSGESGELRSAGDEIARQLDAWRAAHLRILDLIRNKRMHQALALGMNAGIRDYGALNASMTALAQQARARATALADEAAGEADAAIRKAWWMLGALALASILCGGVAIHRVSLIMKRDARLVTRLRENEQRLQMALSGGNQGTWDLDVTTGKLSFDAQWGGLLGYRGKRDRPATLDEWAARISAEDRERVLKAMQDHIAGRTPEYRAEYRIRNHAGELRWVAGHGKAMQRNSHGMATRILGITQEITQRKLSEEKIWNLAHADILTGLPNRVLLYDRLSQLVAHTRRHGTRFALFFLDLDGFKAVNDRFGHDIGDKLLQEVAARLSASIRREDTLARVGGDEFIFILSDIGKREDAITVADTILGLLHEDFVIYGNLCKIGGSIGIAICPDDSDDMDVLVSHADDAMYQAKAKGKNNYQFFQPAGGAAAA